MITHCSTLGSAALMQAGMFNADYAKTTKTNTAQIKLIKQMKQQQ
jgi:hypothetical protein